MSHLEPATYRGLFSTETGRMGSLPPDALPAEVAHLEGWTVHSVIGHSGWLLRWVALLLQSTPDDAPSRSAVGEPPIGPDVLGWFDEAATEMEQILAGADLDAMRPSWIGPQPTSWWLRRVTNEMAMHRWDAQSAVGQPEPIDGELARDGIDEVLEVFVPNRLQFDVLAGSGETIHLHATDLEAGEWMMTLQPDEVAWEHGHAKGDVAARGSMSDLLLLLWGRIPPGRLEVFGDASLLDRWQRAAKF